MFNKILINKTNLLNNLRFLKNLKPNAKICVMVKANAYGHGVDEIVECLKEQDLTFGVSSQEEAFYLRKLTNKDIIIFGAVDKYEDLINNDIQFALFSFEQLKNIINIAKKIKNKPKMHLCLNTGMNRYGIKTKSEFLKITRLLQKHGIILAGLYTHFSSLTTDSLYTKMQEEKFYKFCKLLPKKSTIVKHVGGGRTIFSGIEADMYRVGIEVYGYGNKNLKPVMSVISQIVDIVKVKKNEHVGYLCGFTASKNMIVGAVPIGYADGLPRKLSNYLIVTKSNESYSNVGNICMDCFMLDTKGELRIGDKICVMDNANKLAEIIGTSEYEVLTNFGHARCVRIIVE